MKLRLVYNFSFQPFSVGDVLMFQVLGLLLVLEQGLEGIDFYFIYDPKCPAVPDAAFSYVTKENFLELVQPLLTLVKLSPQVYHMELLTHKQYGELDLAEVVYPETHDQYMYYDIVERLTAFFHARGSVPHLVCPSYLTLWSSSFTPREYVSVNLRRNLINPGRNSNFQAWAEMFRCFPNTTFVVVGEAHERDNT